MENKDTDQADSKKKKEGRKDTGRRVETRKRGRKGGRRKRLRMFSSLLVF